MSRSIRRCGLRVRSAFTLIELLVVISIISFLMALLLPAMSGARRMGQKIACLASARGMASGMQAYGSESMDWILGAPSSSGAYLHLANSVPFRAPVAFGPAVQRWDFMGALAGTLGIDLAPNSGTVPQVRRRFNDIRNHPAFLCKSNNFLAAKFAGVDAGVGRMISYNTARYPLFIRAASGAEAGFPKDGSEGLSWYANGHPESKLPSEWRPSTTRIGVPANKIYVADGSRFSTYDQPPDYDLDPHALWGGAFSDSGAHTTFSRSWDRSHAPGNAAATGGAPGTDARFYGFRHSTGTPKSGAPGNAFKTNAIFYDGHGETMGDLQFSNPQFWLPGGSRMAAISGVWNDTINHFGLKDGQSIGP